MIPKVAVINDLSGFGRCSLTAAIPVLSAMGVQPVPFPTAVLTAQTDYGVYYCDDFTDRMHHFTEEWLKMGASFDGIYSGCLVGSEQAEIVLDFLEKFRGEDTFLLVDPVLGDNGSTYDFYHSDLKEKMRTLVEQADVITPNLTELCLLTGISFREGGALSGGTVKTYLDEIREGAASLLDRPGKRVIVTGIRFPDAKTGEEQIGNLLVSEEDFQLMSGPCHSGSYSGTGDILSSVITGSVLRGDSVEDALVLAGRFLDASIRAAALDGTPGNDGVHFEQYMHMLCSGR